MILSALVYLSELLKNNHPGKSLSITLDIQGRSLNFVLEQFRR